jgi:hypothetical protein
VSDLYDTDFVRWAEEQAELLRKTGVEGRLLANEQPDWSNIAEEIEGLAKANRRELENRIRTILAHLIKLQASPATEPRAGWHETIIEARAQVRGLLKDSPSLVPTVAEVIADELPTARELALTSLGDHGEQPRVDPAELNFTEDQVRGPWLP